MADISIRWTFLNLSLRTISVLPKIVPFSFGDGPVNSGESIQVVCSVSKGDRPLTISWSFYGEALSSDMGLTTQMLGDTTNFLSIPSAGPSNQGNYTCIAKNSAGLDAYTSQLVVYGIHNWSCNVKHDQKNIENNC